MIEWVRGEKKDVDKFIFKKVRINLRFSKIKHSFDLWNPKH